MAKKVSNNTRGGKSVVVAFGRFQPPTIGHQLLVDKVVETAKRLGADHAMFSSRTNDPKKNPLTPRQKFKWLKRLFPTGNFKDIPAIRTPVDMLYWLAERGYDSVYLVGGEDRAGNYKEFANLMSKRGAERLKLKSFKVVNAGARDPDARGVQGMSASKMRAAVQAGNMKAFARGLPRGANTADARALFAEVKKGMTMKEEAQIDYNEIYSAAAVRLTESDKHKRRPPTPGQKDGFSKHNKRFKTPPCAIDEWFSRRWLRGET